MNNPNVLINSDYGPIIININDQFISKEIIKNGFYNSEDINFIKKYLKFNSKNSIGKSRSMILDLMWVLIP